MEETSFLIESETDLLWLANNCHVGGSLGVTARDLAAVTIEQEPSIMAWLADVIGSYKR